MRTVVAVVIMLTAVAGCANRPTSSTDTGGPVDSKPGPDPSALTRSIGQGCTWYDGLTVAAVAVHRSAAGYTVQVRVTNKTPKSYATGALVVELWVGPNDNETHGLGSGLPNDVVASGKSVTGDYRFRSTGTAAPTRVAVGIQASPTAQQCLLRGTAGQE